MIFIVEANNNIRNMGMVEIGPMFGWVLGATWEGKGGGAVQSVQQRRGWYIGGDGNSALWTSGGIFLAGNVFRACKRLHTSSATALLFRSWFGQTAGMVFGVEVKGEEG